MPVPARELRPLMRSHPVHVLPPDLSKWASAPLGVPYVHERRGDVDGPDILVTALAHGNEYAGATVISELLSSKWTPTRGRVTFAFCNVVAFHRFDATRPDESRFADEDFNRVWGVETLDGPEISSELARARQLRPFVDRASHLLDLHSMHEPSTPLLITGVLKRNIEFAKTLRAHAQIVVDEGHSDGVRMRDYDAFSDMHGEKIAVLLEAGQHWEASSIAVTRDVLMRFLIQAGAIDLDRAPSKWLLPDRQSLTPVRVTDRVVAQSTSFDFCEPFTGGEVIPHAGTVIATDAGAQIVTPYDDCVLVMPSLRQLRPGVTTVRFGKFV